MSAPFINDNYSSDRLKSGYNSYHTNSGDRIFNTPVEIEGRKPSRFFMGSEIEMAFKSESKRREFCSNESNWYVCESDGSLVGAAPMELITIPLHPDDATNPEFWRPLCKKLSSMGARSWANSSTGHHVHVSRTLFCDPEASIERQYVQARTGIKKMCALYALFIEDNECAQRVFGRKRCYNQCKMKDTVSTTLSETVPDLMVKEPKLYNLIVKAVTDSSHTRTREVNTRNEHTIEFRMGKGSICAERIAAINEFVLLFCLWTMQVKLGAACTLRDFEAYMRAHTRPDSWLCHFYFNEPSPNGEKQTAPSPRTSTSPLDDDDE